MNMLTSSTGPTPCTLSFLSAVWSFLSSAGPACLGATFLRIGALAPPACVRPSVSQPPLFLEETSGPCPALRCPGRAQVEEEVTGESESERENGLPSLSWAALAWRALSLFASKSDITSESAQSERVRRAGRESERFEQLLHFFNLRVRTRSQSLGSRG